MRQEISLYGRQIPYTVRQSRRAKRLRIAVYCNCDVVVTLPHNKTLNDVEMFLRKKARWIFDKLDKFKKAKHLQLNDKSIKFEDAKGSAHKLVESIIKKFNKTYKFKYNKINIKNHKTKWGSCSRKRNLNFNYRITFLPRRLAEYIVVHELCHLEELSHSIKYWNSVGKMLPNYKSLLGELKGDFYI